MPAVAGDFRHGYSRLPAGFIEQAQFDALGDLGKNREVSARAIIHRTKGIRSAGPDFHSNAWPRGDEGCSYCIPQSYQRSTAVLSITCLIPSLLALKLHQGRVSLPGKMPVGGDCLHELRQNVSKIVILEVKHTRIQLT